MISACKLSGRATTAREMDAALALLQLHDQAPHRAQELPLIENGMDMDDTATVALYLLRMFEPANVESTAAVSQPGPVASSTPKVKKTILKNRNVNCVANDNLVPIGLGHAKVPSQLLNSIRWTPKTYTSATRKLLMAVFPRSVLATHSLTGKASPAFQYKPAKEKLNAQLVDDIVHTVVSKCGVAANLVRTSITTKCADESKMLRSRLKKQTNSRKNLENRAPRSTSESN
ncbi:protein insensitive-like [Plodia interpunctella]|uniref:protein insensitive-like n=1 Tax=Plodia interpunctella TaxID=58824 RepID=UPI003100E569